jgi:hypothetical protein
VDTRAPGPARAGTPSAAAVALPEAALEGSPLAARTEDEDLLEAGARIELVGRSLVLLERVG